MQYSVANVPNKVRRGNLERNLYLTSHIITGAVRARIFNN